jgi:EmrB/QacA subfamily drug resistance transporter
MTLSPRARWLALYVLCLGDLMIVLDGTIVNVALPTIRDDLGFSETSLAWVVNGYLLTFGGFLLLGGRLGDLFGQRRMFLIGISLFTVASFACGLATSQGQLVASRAVQGLGGALVASVALSLVMTLFTEQAERAKAMGIFGSVLSGGGVAGVLLGGVLTDILSWHWIFFINIPVGIAVFLLTRALLPGGTGVRGTGRLDWGGAVLITSSLMLAVYAIVKTDEHGWVSGHTLGLLAVAVGFFGAFLVLESRIGAPLMPLGIFRNRNVSTANAMGALMSAGLLALFFFSALYLQQTLGYTPLEVGLAYLPMTIVWGAASLFLSDRLVMRFGIKPPLVGGLALMIVACVLFARVPVDGNWAIDVLPATLFFALGAGVGFNPLLLAAMSGVAPTEAGLASGVVNTAFMMGGAVGLAVLASVSASRTESLLEGGDSNAVALLGGYHAAFVVGAVLVAVSAILGALLLRPAEGAPAHGEEPIPEAA